jgi:hypothetical protein
MNGKKENLFGNQLAPSRAAHNILVEDNDRFELLQPSLQVHL